MPPSLLQPEKFSTAQRCSHDLDFKLFFHHPERFTENLEVAYGFLVEARRLQLVKISRNGKAKSGRMN